MTIEEAKIILKDNIDEEDGSLCLNRGLDFIVYNPGSLTACLDGVNFTANKLEAIAVYMRSTQKVEP